MIALAKNKFLSMTQRKGMTNCLIKITKDLFKSHKSLLKIQITYITFIKISYDYL